ncbi:23690_t:CDS:2 [Gigaspora margarita]|uniref:23690_t:CDS:1 n=1 Tax=Gigaspora margarita TaxID=4874 RepID=A0ABN7W6T4_GIGMA|nr:23690_t:CDS:2 [Gigaspora margarita]
MAKMDLRTYSDSNFVVKIIVGNGRDIKEFKAHSTTLRSRSLYFQRALSERWNNKEHAASDELEIFKLTECIQDHLTKKHSSWLFFNFVVSLDFVCHHNHFRKLYDFVLNFTCRNPYLLFNSIDLLLLDKVTMICLLERDDLEFEERDIWDYLIKWGITNSKKLLDQNISNWFDEDITNWSDDQFSALKETISQCIPLIRYCHIPKSYIDE